MKFQNLLYFLVVFVMVVSCKRTLEKLPNQLPDTVIAPAEINLSGDDRLNSVVFLSWFGTDVDGYVKGFEVSLDNINWTYTTSNDSIFNFNLAPGTDTTDIDFYVRAIDNENQKDPQPAYLKVPLKNTPPSAFFVEQGFPADTVNIVSTFRWGSSDPDGDETVVHAFLKANQGDWLEIDVNSSVISVIPQSPNVLGAGNALIYYGNNVQPITDLLTDVRVGDTNTFYIKVVDFADAESEVDTSATIYIKPKTANTLLVNGMPPGPGDIYKTLIQGAIGNVYDVAEYALDNGKYTPGYWTPTFDFLLAQYETVLFFSDNSIVTNSVNGRKDVLLEFAAPSLQIFSNNGGKSLVVTNFNAGQDITGITSTLPIDSISSSGGQARLYPDSAIYSVTGPNYPSLHPTSVLSGLTPFYFSADAQEAYAAQFTKLSGWNGPSTVGARRLNGNNQIYQYFFSIQLYRLDQSMSDLQTLFNQILNNDFNW